MTRVLEQLHVVLHREITSQIAELRDFATQDALDSIVETACCQLVDAQRTQNVATFQRFGSIKKFETNGTRYTRFVELNG